MKSKSQTHTKHKHTQHIHALNFKTKLLMLCKKNVQNEVTLDKINISCIEPISQALVWPTYQQATSAQTSLQPPHLLLPPLQQSLQPPPLALLGSDYLTASTTLHQVRSFIDLSSPIFNFFFPSSVPFTAHIHSQHTISGFNI